MKPSTSSTTTLHLLSTTSSFISSMEDCNTLERERGGGSDREGRMEGERGEDGGRVGEDGGKERR